MPAPRYLLVLALSFATLAACREDGRIPEAKLNRQLTRLIERSTGEEVAALRLPHADDLDAVPQHPSNPLTPAKVALGRLLFHETGLSVATIDAARRGTVSCASCHVAAAGFQANLPQGLGEGGAGFGESGEARFLPTSVKLAEVDVQAIRTPSVLNVAYASTLHWNGELGSGGANEGTERQWTEGTVKEHNALGYGAAETQALAGLEVHRMAVTPALVETLGYRELFDAAFAQVPEADRYSRFTAALAIAAYERTLLPTRSPWQRWLGGEPLAMSAAELRGAKVFFGDGGCVGCHNGPALSGQEFHALGMADLHEGAAEAVRSTPDMNVHKGRAGFTQRTDDLYAFRVPQLYNLADSPFYGHGASFRSIDEVIRYKAAAIAQNERVDEEHLSEKFVPLKLTKRQQADLATFIESALRDPDLARYAPEALPSRRPFPNADLTSIYEQPVEAVTDVAAQ